MFLSEQAVLHRFEKYVPSSWEDESVLEDEDACHQIESAEDEVVMWLHHTQARQAQPSVLKWCFCLMTMSACTWRALQYMALLYIRVSNQPYECHSSQTQGHSPGTFDEAIFSRYVFRNVCAGASLLLPLLLYFIILYRCSHGSHASWDYGCSMS